MADLIRPTGSWRQISGLAYGLQQPALIGSIALGRLSAQRLQNVRRDVQTLIDEPLLDESSGVPQPDQLARMFAFCVGAIQRQSRIAVSVRFDLQRGANVGPDEVPFHFALPSPNVRASKIAADWVLAVINRVAQGTYRPEESGATRDAIHQKLRRFANPGLNRFSIIEAANALDIPLLHLTQTIFVLGTGMHARWMDSTITDATPSIGVAVAKLKDKTAHALRTAGLPGGVNLLVGSSAAAVDGARKLGFPVVVKPADKDQGVGVAADLRDESSVVQAYEAARKFSDNVLVEKWVAGFTHRLTVFNDKVIRVARRVAGGVTGDGVSDIKTLVARYQQTERQQRLLRHFGKPLLELDEEALGLLRQNGLDALHVPAPAEYVRLRRRDNINTGGSNEDLALDFVHPDNLRLAVDAANLLRLDFAGVDLIMQDISQSWLSTGALICEVNAQPQLGTSSAPTIYREILAEFMAGGCTVPAHLLICPVEESHRKVALERILAVQPWNGVSDRTGLWVNGLRIAGPFDNGFQAARALLMRKQVQGATCLMTPKDIVRFGLPVANWDKVKLFNLPAFSDEERSLLPQAKAMVQGAREPCTSSNR